MLPFEYAASLSFSTLLTPSDPFIIPFSVSSHPFCLPDISHMLRNFEDLSREVKELRTGISELLRDIR